LSEAANLGERQPWKGSSPFALEASGILGREREEQLEVFALSEGLSERTTASKRDARFVEREPAAARLGEARQVGGKAVAHIHHRVRFEMRDEPARFGEARVKSRCLPAREPPRRPVTNSTSPARPPERRTQHVAFDPTNDAHIHKKRSRRA
jgi:hypothetical protein